MENQNNETNDVNEQTKQPKVNEWDKPLAERYGLTEDEIKAISDSYTGDVSKASTLQLELLINSKHPNAQDALQELQLRNTIAAMEKQKAEIEELRGVKKETAEKQAENEKLRSAVKNEPMGVVNNFSKLLKSRNIKLPPMFRAVEHSPLVDKAINKFREPKKGK